MAINADPAQRANPSARWLQMTGRRRRTARYVVAVSALASLLSDRRTRESVIVLALGVAAAAGLAREGQSRSLARLLAWDERQYRRYLSKAEKNQA